MPFNIGPGELIIILAIALVVFGPGKLPEIGSAVGKGIREFRRAATDVSDATRVDAPAPPPASPSPAAQAPSSAPSPMATPVTPATPPPTTAAPLAPAAPEANEGDPGQPAA
jgi:sec-independent protein translocase protein TatA